MLWCNHSHDYASFTSFTRDATNGSVAVHGYVTGWGKVDPESATRDNPPANAAHAAPVAGLVTAILGTEGERVRRGTTLFRLDSRITEVAVERARQAVRFAEGLVERQEQLGPGQATSQRAYQEAKQQLTAAQSELNTAEVQRRLLDVTAPIDGTVMRINAKFWGTRSMVSRLPDGQKSRAQDGPFQHVN